FELKEENIHSTANIFNLPLSYHYGIGSHGFSAWRELAAHIAASDWVLTGQCATFPVLYHWRTVASTRAAAAVAQQLGDIDKHMKSWQDAPEIRRRIEDLCSAPGEILLFLEHMPHTLTEWLSAQLTAPASGSSQPLTQALDFAETNLSQINDFMYERGFVHFDAHFDNVLTDGKSLLLSDFGLALAEEFNLSVEEREFLKLHLKSYDRATSASYLTHSVIAGLFGKAGWRESLRNTLDEMSDSVPEPCAQIIQTYGKITLATDEFLEKLKQAPIGTEYPAAQLEHLLFEIECAKIARFLGPF
ncbi:MAG TPA: hypothetical protein V6C72_01780, partial [Chroococcales cyanobacterium]